MKHFWQKIKKGHTGEHLRVYNGSMRDGCKGASLMAIARVCLFGGKLAAIPPVIPATV